MQFLQDDVNLQGHQLVECLGVQTPTGRISPRCFATGSSPAKVSTEGTNLDVVTTETYHAEVFIPATTLLTGIAVMNGGAVAGNLTVYLSGPDGTVVASSASTAQSGTDSYQRIPFSAQYLAKGPATYYVSVQGNNTGADLNMHTFGNFGASKTTSTTYGTLTSITVPTTFTTGVGPIASVY